MIEERRQLVARLYAARDEWYRLQRETLEAQRHAMYLNRELERFDWLAHERRFQEQA